jgi:hypothetical protein
MAKENIAAEFVAGTVPVEDYLRLRMKAKLHQQGEWKKISISAQTLGLNLHDNPKRTLDLPTILARFLVPKVSLDKYLPEREDHLNVKVDELSELLAGENSNIHPRAIEQMSRGRGQMTAELLMLNTIAQVLAG